MQYFDYYPKSKQIENLEGTKINEQNKIKLPLYIFVNLSLNKDKREKELKG